MSGITGSGNPSQMLQQLQQIQQQAAQAEQAQGTGQANLANMVNKAAAPRRRNRRIKSKGWTSSSRRKRPSRRV